MRAKLNIPGTLTLLALVALWEVAVRGGAVTFDYLPAPSAIAVAFVGIVRSGELLTATLHTLGSVLIGWVLALVIGGALGLLFGLSAFARRWFLATLEVLRPLPAIAFLPVALLLFSFSLTTELVVMVYASIWPMFINTMGGIANVSSRLNDVGLTLKLSPTQTLLKVLIPAAAPSILVGARLCLGLTLVLAIIAEMIGNPHGLGYAVVNALIAIQPEQMFAYVLFIGVLAIALNALLLQAARLLLPAYGRGAVETV
ncbi:MAG TPA: ABC transporter permease subunit [Xanthobacteraceae bacterium]|jgi:ABC-type nitrate/sulfonate/bicarbonate transport system permease component|nr:ABC transporter permease subunit [Xanthobacteraceae bacterium]